MDGVLLDFCGTCNLGFAVCHGRRCQAALCTLDPSDTLPACTDAGGACQYAAGPTDCSKPGPPDACAYSDEVCCVD